MAVAKLPSSVGYTSPKQGHVQRRQQVESTRDAAPPRRAKLLMYSGRRGISNYRADSNVLQDATPTMTVHREKASQA